MNMTIGSGDISSLLSGYETKSYRELWKKFISNEKPIYNAKASPIDALRTGAILEDRYYLTLPSYYFPQVKVKCKEQDVLVTTLDFSSRECNNNFEELKSVEFNDFLKIQMYKDRSYKEYIHFIKKYYKKYYNQVQSQIYSTGLDYGTLTFLAVFSYDDEVNYNRYIKDNEVVKFMINREEETINLIKHRLTPFQQFKDFHTKK